MTTTVLHPLPLTLAERELAPDTLRVKASFDEYLDFAEQCEYTIEYVNGEIISMSQASLPHESLVSRLNYLLVSLFDSQDELTVYSSNIKIFIEATGDSVNADVSVVQGPPDYLVLPSGNVSTATVKNPVLLIEVLSQSTLAFDLGEKLELYKQIPGLKQVLFVSQHKPWVISYVRADTPGLWLNTSAHNLTESVPVLGNDVALSAIYKKFPFA
ncbi:Uma2 family endonuclease [Spirosoma spitsbergense]|uniref:Uma2 family endonuclease n=1 Tax=Spirosoma spitsbergense TaxID=431554 RepID=UPI000373EA08|nr:Uma2 family endonuclease [Spirosoma spitsbergense]